ncbi:hypothetical protein SASPL_113730 [Salvia splendens]|uniref:Uncharacterized protein n=1 Tax=Salvia splendens TaxID=180675 RepID=A0A8X8XZE9_SALSN|nr:hypothetical protein SASPL_113730 [Salvia splendens]
MDGTDINFVMPDRLFQPIRFGLFIFNDFSGKRQLTLSSVSRIIQEQRTICKDKVEAEIWNAGLKSLISTGQSRSRRTKSDFNDLHGGGDISQDNRTFGALEGTPLRVSTDSRDSSVSSSSSHVGSECNSMQRTSCADGFLISVSSSPSCSSQSSGPW